MDMQREVRIEGNENSSEIRRLSADLMASFRRWKLPEVLLEYHFNNGDFANRTGLYAVTPGQQFHQARPLEPYLIEEFGRMGQKAIAEMRKSSDRLLELADVRSTDFDEVSGSIVFKNNPEHASTVYWEDEARTQTQIPDQALKLTEQYRSWFRQGLREVGASNLLVVYSITDGNQDLPDYFFGDAKGQTVKVDRFSESFLQIETDFFEMLEREGVLTSWPRLDCAGELSVDLSPKHKNYWWHTSRRELRFKTVRSFHTAGDTSVSTGGGLIQPEVLVPLWQ